jgi:hypothetical protein
MESPSAPGVGVGPPTVHASVERTQHWQELARLEYGWKLQMFNETVWRSHCSAGFALEGAIEFHALAVHLLRLKCCHACDPMACLSGVRSLTGGYCK